MALGPSDCALILCILVQVGSGGIKSLATAKAPMTMDAILEVSSLVHPMAWAVVYGNQIAYRQGIADLPH